VLKPICSALLLFLSIRPLLSQSSDSGVRTIERWQKKLRKIHQKIESGDYQTADKAADKLIIEEMVPSLLRGEAGAELLALATVYQALAEAGSGEEDSAIWHWQIAQNLDPELRQVSLAKFGSAAHLLEYNRLRLAGEPPRDMTVFDLSNPQRTPTHPKAVEVPYPFVPPGLQAVWYEETAEVESVIDEKGRVRSPVVIQGTLPGKIYLGIESMRAWRYQPATLDGEPVAVYFQLEDFYEILP
jgi:hypothetical protein